ncbi:probable G-protein coupled receptor 132b [Esox lucius]|uniref:G-protein coupled receptors family 1 profile domain-containing protein n=1 Tax=Esox lucius TaxID=8010 RepID=A0A3P8XNW4_ESOLU|nr:probable G-protein coupled receptor 132b [Esox lucius]XP_010880773.1 probable G-protein coupled receptor 132b [Esox lucius]
MHEPTTIQTSLAATNLTTGSTPEPSCVLNYENDRVPLVVLYSVVLVIGVPANIVTVYLTFLQVLRKNVLGIYLLSLSMCDLMYLCTLPMWADYVNTAHRWRWSPMACKVTGYFFFNNMYISILLLCCISSDRYVAVVYALESRGVRRQKLAVGVTLTIVLVVFLGHTPVFTMPEGDVQEGRCFEPGQSTPTVTGFNYARFLIGFFVPLVILVVTNRGILVNVQASTGLRPCQKKRVRYLAYGVVFLFLGCFAPYHLILLVRAVTFHIPKLQKTCHFEQSIYTPYTISLGLSTFNSAINPILYVLSSDNIRKELRRAFTRIRWLTTLQPRSTDSSQHRMHNSKNSSEVVVAAREVEKQVC